MSENVIPFFLHCRSSVVPLSKHTFEFCSSAGKCHESFYLNDLTRYVLTLRNCNLTLILVVIFSVFSGCQFRLHVGRCLPKSGTAAQQVSQVQKGKEEEGNKSHRCKLQSVLYSSPSDSRCTIFSRHGIWKPSTAWSHQWREALIP